MLVAASSAALSDTAAMASPMRARARLANWPISPRPSLEATSSRWVRSPSATAAKTVTASAIGVVMLRAMRQATTRARAAATPQRTTMTTRKPSAISRAAAPSAWFLASSRSISTLIDASQSLNSGETSVISSLTAASICPALRSAMTSSTSGSVSRSTSRMTSYASTSSCETFASSAKNSSSFSADAA